MDAGNFFERVLWHNATASHFGFKTIAPGHKLSIPAAQIFQEQCEAKALLEASKVIGSVDQGDGDAQPTLVPKQDHGG